MEHNTSDQRTDRIINSLDGLQKATAPDFFYTRLTGRMQRATEPVRNPFFLLRPAFITPVLLLVFIVNIFSLTQLNKQSEQKTNNQLNKAASLNSFAEAYNMNTESVYE